jgi:hypothetical protein
MNGVTVTIPIDARDMPEAGFTRFRGLERRRIRKSDLGSAQQWSMHGPLFFSQ